MSRIERYFEDIRPVQTAEQIAQGVMRKAESGAKKRSFRPLVAVAAAVAVTAAGVTTAAATGFLNINEIFGGRISAQDEMLAGELVGAAKNFAWTTSDDDYVIEFKGVTGSSYDMLVAYEIKRADGKPVTEYMINIPEDGMLKCIHADTSFDNDEFEIYRYGNEVHRDLNITLNDEGNIDVYQMISADGNIADADYSLMAMNFYPAKLLEQFEKQNDVFLWYGEGTESPAGFYSWDNSSAFYAGEYEDIALNDERVIGLELEWTVAFYYDPSEAAIAEKSADIAELALYWDNEIGGFGSVNVNAIRSHFSCIGGRMVLNYTAVAVKGSLSDEYNEIFLVMNDGVQIPCQISGNFSYSEDEFGGTVSAFVKYGTAEHSNITVVDITKVDAISINGEIFPLA